MKKDIDYTIGSGNVFEDLGLSNPAERLAKAELAYKINSILKAKKLTQVAAAKLLKIDQPKISALRNGNLSGFSLERLFRFLNILDQDVVINISTKPKKRRSAGLTITNQKSKMSRVVPTPSEQPRSMRVRTKSK